MKKKEINNTVASFHVYRHYLRMETANEQDTVRQTRCSKHILATSRHHQISYSYVNV